jgi:2-oxo-4-hydroxy-4-carboxy--5-ureidoimidazoline (OHCU) decarboxylase
MPPSFPVNLNPALSRIIPKLETRISPLGFHQQSTTMNINTLIPTFIFVLMTITALVQAAPNGADKGARRDTTQNSPTESREEFLKKHPEVREKFEKLKDMSPEERRAFFKDHPEFAEKIKDHAKDGAKDATPDSRADFLKDHPELKEHMEKLKSMTPEERKAWLKEHPEVAEKIEKAKAKFKEKAEDATPEQKEKLKAKMKERFEKMTPEQKAEVLKNHPELKEKPEDAKK